MTDVGISGAPITPKDLIDAVFPAAGGTNTEITILGNIPGFFYSGGLQTGSAIPAKNLQQALAAITKLYFMGTTIGSQAFRNASFSLLTLMNFPALTTLGDNAFLNVKFPLLESMNFPKLINMNGASFQSIVFTSLTSMSFPLLATMDYNAFIQTAFPVLKIMSFDALTSMGSSIFSNHLSSTRNNELQCSQNHGISSILPNNIFSAQNNELQSS